MSQAEYVRTLEMRVQGLESLLSSIIALIPDKLLDETSEEEFLPTLLYYVEKAEAYLRGGGTL